LIERRYAPYGKWLGAAFKRLKLRRKLAQKLERSLAPFNSDFHNHATVTIPLMRLENLSTTQLFELLVGGGILAIILIGLVAIIFRRRKSPPSDGD
jgi:hypothetical protein